MNKSLFIVVALILTLSACADENVFSINQDLIEKGVIEISLPNERPKNLAIKDPDGQWFVLQDEAESIESFPQSTFDTVKIMKLDMKEVMGTVWRDGVKSEELVFKESGKYLIYFANNLETEPENTFSFQSYIEYQN